MDEIWLKEAVSNRSKYIILLLYQDLPLAKGGHMFTLTSQRLDTIIQIRSSFHVAREVGVQLMTVNAWVKRACFSLGYLLLKTCPKKTKVLTKSNKWTCICLEDHVSLIKKIIVTFNANTQSRTVSLKFPSNIRYGLSLLYVKQLLKSYKCCVVFRFIARFHFNKLNVFSSMLFMFFWNKGLRF